MKPVVPALVLAFSVVAGCSQSQSLDPQLTDAYRAQERFDSWAVASVNEASVRNAVLEQHALFPYHFVPGSAALTEIGQRDLSILADGYKSTPGPLALIKGDTPDELYTQRKNAIASALQQAGLSGITITDGPVGGRGITGNEAVAARRQKKEAYGSPANTDTGSYTDTGSVAPMGENK